MAHDHLA